MNCILVSFFQENVNQLVDFTLKEYAFILEYPITVSLIYYVMWILIGWVFRRIINTYCPKPFAPYAMNFVMTYVLMAMSLEGGQITKHYGALAYFVANCCLGMFNTYLNKNEPLTWSSNPKSYAIKYVQGDASFKSAVLHALCQLVGGLLSFSSARLFWSMGLTESHAQRYTTQHCTTDLTVSVSMGFTIEFGVTLLLTVLGFISSGNATTQWFLDAFNRFLSCLTTHIFVNQTGMYGNAIKATNQTFGCQGTSVLDHLFVYWLSTILAGVVSVYVFRFLNYCCKLIIGSFLKQLFRCVRACDQEVTEVNNNSPNRLIKIEIDENKFFDCVETNAETEMRRRSTNKAVGIICSF